MPGRALVWLRSVCDDDVQVQSAAVRATAADDGGDDDRVQRLQAPPAAHHRRIAAQRNAGALDALELLGKSLSSYRTLVDLRGESNMSSDLYHEEGLH
mmetsp:Transcript_7470/g.10607  ORF Transcript_7470/g.10607 Transcript_7470/m.10607 type:complete len:98 (+) Transcript_7470:352-645(+)